MIRRFWLLMLALVATSSTRSWAQESFTTVFARGRVLLQNDDERALPTLRRAVEISEGASQGQQVAAVLALARATSRWQNRNEAVSVLAGGLARNDVNEIRSALAPLLFNGLPTNASDTTLKILSQTYARGEWTIQQSVFPLPRVSSTTEYSNSAMSRELLWTNGPIWVNGINKDGASQLWRTPALYAAYANLPPTLKMNRVVYGYVRQKNGVWRQAARVLFAHSEEEKELAQKMCQQFLKVYCSFSDLLGRENLYGDVTTIWLSRESALWPQVENAAQWNAGAWLDSSPSEIILFRTGEGRSDAEWLREIAHEYSHVVFPPFAGYQWPLEPFGNGVQGETLLMLWALSSPQSFFSSEDGDEATKQLRVHVARHAVPAWNAWRTRDPRKMVDGADESARRVLQGATLWTERVYDSALLGEALRSCDGDEQSRAHFREAALVLARRRNASHDSTKILRASALQSALTQVLDADFAKRKKQMMWLGGALNPNVSPDDLARRNALVLPPNARANGWIYVPRGARTLRIEIANKSTHGSIPNAPTSSTRSALSVEGWKLRATKNAVILLCESNSGKRKTGWHKLAVRASERVVLAEAVFE